jgi:molecular chaperone DnaK (HSP70)
LETLEKPFIVGIDLGTTNSAVAYATTERAKTRIEIFRIPQLTGPGEFGPLAVLPSFLYLPGDYDVDPQAILSPWQISDDAFVGAFARDQGASVPARLVSSAKSWLCHPNVDRKARILPWGTRAELKKRSPVQATAAYLEHIKKAWNHGQGEEEMFLENQSVILTVPASFDEVARELTLEAAQLAGYQSVTLLEEPLAAFYSWLVRHEAQWPSLVQPNELILICDVGGGTTDFTLVTLKASPTGGPRFERIAVGDHLLLGGDNMDLALARRVEMSWAGQGRTLDADRWKSLCHQCRNAKEQILSGAAETWRIALAGKGSRLIGGALTAELDRQTVEQTVLEGFFPLVDETTAPAVVQRRAIAEFGLPYEPDPAISRHLIRFLERHRNSVADAIGKATSLPDRVLFNGGALGPRIVQEKIVAALRHWFKPDIPDVPRVLDNPVPDLAVGLGAAYYGRVKAGRGVRVGSGSPRAYYLGIARASGSEAVPQAICLVERGLEEGAVIDLPARSFEVLTNQPVRFDLYSSSFRSGDRSGQLVTIDESLTSLPPLQTVIQYGKQGLKRSIPVRIEAHYSELGTLSLWCRSQVSQHRWQLQFQLRSSAVPTGVREETVLEAVDMEKARNAMVTAFAGTDRALLESLVKKITQIVDLSREQWPLSLIRELSDTLLEAPQVRQSSPLHEARWMNLMGFCLRPGVGHGLDAQRVQKAWRLYGQGPIHPRNRQVSCEWWIMWRRLAAGLSAGQQRQISQEVTPQLIPSKGKITLAPQEQSEIWMTLANLERLSVTDKIQWGRALLPYVRPTKSKTLHLWSLARLGARELLYGPADRVIPPQETAAWIETLLAQNWGDPKPVVSALVQMARKTGDRTRDFEPLLIDRMLDWMTSVEAPADQRRCLTDIVPLDRQAEQAIFGESLPAGLVLREPATQGA